MKKMYSIKPLNWKDEEFYIVKPNVSYVAGDFFEYAIVRNKENSFTARFFYHQGFKGQWNSDSLEMSKKKCESHYRATIKKVLTGYL